MTIIIFLIILSVLVIAHEAGHFFAARKFGVRVDEFGLGFPPKAKALGRWKGTLFTLNWLPFGGFVKIFGENFTGDSENAPDSFSSKSKIKQIIILAAGVLSNFALAWLLFTIVLMLGIESQTGFVKRGLLDGLWHGFLTTGKLTWLTAKALLHLSINDVVGPVGIVGLVGEAKALGLSYLFYFAALISVNLGIINLIPIPALDGGRILLVIIEAIRKKRLSAKLFNIINLASFALLILLMVIITVRDVGRLL